MNAIDPRKASLATKVKWGLGLAAALLISPVIFMIVRGLVGLALAGIVGLAVINFAPVLSMKFANWKLKAIKFEAGRNPVETLQNVWNEKSAALVELLSRIEEFAASVKTFEGKLGGFKREFPADAARFEETLGSMQQLLEVRRDKWAASKADLDRLSGEIRKADAIWKMGLAAQSMHRAAGMSEGDFMQRIKTETAFEAVDAALNRSLAELESSLAMEAPALEFQPADVIDVPVRVKEVTR